MWGVLISFEKVGKAKQQQLPAEPGGADGDGSAFRGGGGGGPRFAVDVLVCCDPETLPKAGGAGGRALPALLPPGAPGGSPQVVTLPLEHLAALSSARMRGLQDLRAPQVGALFVCQCVGSGAVAGRGACAVERAHARAVGPARRRWVP